jgi:ferrous iron transport protein A
VRFIDNGSQMQDASPVSTLLLDALGRGAHGTVHGVEWDRLDPADARRLREFGLFEGVEIEVLHRGSLFSRDPLAIRIGGSRVMLRAEHARAIHISVATTPRAVAA